MKEGVLLLEEGRPGEEEGSGPPLFSHLFLRGAQATAVQPGASAQPGRPHGPHHQARTRAASLTPRVTPESSGVFFLRSLTIFDIADHYGIMVRKVVRVDEKNCTPSISNYLTLLNLDQHVKLCLNTFDDEVSHKHNKLYIHILLNKPNVQML